MTQKFTEEEVRANIAANRRYMTTETELQLTAYADTLSKPADSGRVGEDVVDRVAKAIADAAGHGMREKCMHLAHAALAAQGQGEAVEIEAVGRVERDMTGDLGINWLIEGGIHGVGEGSVLLCADRDNVTDDEGSATLYTSAPPASPAGVPDGTWLWFKLMDWCKKRRVAPAEYSDLFDIAGEAHKLAAPSQPEDAA